MSGGPAEYEALRAKLSVFYADAEPVSIPKQVHDLAWAHLAAIAASRIAFAVQRSRKPNVFENPLLQEFLWTNALAPQFLGITRLVDNRGDVIALPRIVKDLRGGQAFVTRQAYVTCGDVPYDADAAAEDILAAGFHGWKDDDGGWFFADDPSQIGLPDPRASQLRQRLFDVWSGCPSDARKPGDLIRPSVFEVLDREIDALQNGGVQRARHKFLAHSADAASRSSGRTEKLGVKTTEIGLADLRREMGRVFAIARILGEMLIADRYSGPIGALAGPATYRTGLLAVPMSQSAAERIGRLPKAMSRLLSSLERHEKRRIERQFI